MGPAPKRSRSSGAIPGARAGAIEREPRARMRTIREVLRLAIRRLSPGDAYAGAAAAEITVLRDVASMLTGEARTDVLKAVAIITDRSD
jgi:hypothetical protein